MGKISIIDKIIAYESGNLSDNDTIRLFANLIRSGQVWSLQGHYSRTASALIQDGFISQGGQVLKTV